MAAALTFHALQGRETPKAGLESPIMGGTGLEPVTPQLVEHAERLAKKWTQPDASA
jgi:hypothetical protein